MRRQIGLFDNLELLCFEKQQAEYPVHYHETYCISLIHEGVFGENELVAPQGGILISHPLEIHSNKFVENFGASFSTFYLNEEVLNYFSPFERTSFQNKVISDPAVFRQLNELIHLVYVEEQNKTLNLDFYNSFSQVIFDLTSGHGIDRSYSVDPSPPAMGEIKQYINEHLATKINLASLAALVGMSKYKFIRWFKRNAGVTPFEYILLQRVGCGKKLIKQGRSLVDVSLDAGFYDQSHFSNYFRRYVGVSPHAYRQTCNIFQDF